MYAKSPTKNHKYQNMFKKSPVRNMRKNDMFNDIVNGHV